MPSIPLRWAAGDRAKWRGLVVLVHYVAEDGALIEYRPAHLPTAARSRFAIVALSDLSLNFPD